MNKQDLINEVAIAADISKVAAERAVESVLDNIAKALKRGDRVTLFGFGNFSVSQKKARVGLNPKTGERIQIPARKAPKFTPSAALKELLNT
ncbi:MAG: HU family DNA-binding protein [bacterium]|nr:HU family DNA-binding protein [bacterium]